MPKTANASFANCTKSLVPSKLRRNWPRQRLDPAGGCGSLREFPASPGGQVFAFLRRLRGENRHAKNYSILVVRWEGRGGGQFLCLHFQEREDRQDESLRGP